MTSPPFGLVRKKNYGNADANEYLEWFRLFAASFKRVLKDNGSLVIDIGGSWIPGQPTRSLYHFQLLIWWLSPMIDPFAGSCVTGEVCERLGRKWVWIDLVEEYLKGALGRFEEDGRNAEQETLDESDGKKRKLELSQTSREKAKAAR